MARKQAVPAATVADDADAERRARERAATVRHEGPGAAGQDYLAYLCCLRQERGERMPWETDHGDA
jgi:hypothetical protein